MSFCSYPEYKSSNISWIGDVPSHWQITRLRNIFQIQKRIAGRLGFDILSITNKGIKIKDIESGDGQLSNDYSKYQIVKQGDFAMNQMDLLTGYVDLSAFDGVTSPDYRVFLLKNHEKDDSHYLLRLLQNAYHQKLFFPYGQGAANIGRWRLPAEEFNNFHFPRPPLAEQAIIARFLDHETARIDALIEQQQRLIELLEEKRQGLALTAYYDASFQELRLENAVDVIVRPVYQQDDEEYVALGLYNRGRGLFHKDPKVKSDMGDSDFSWIESGDLILSGQFAWEGAVALAGEAETGTVVSHRYPVIRGKREVALTEYIFALLTTEHGDFLLNENSRGAAGRNRPLNLGSLLKEKIKIPPPLIQTRIAALIHEERAIREEAESQKSLLLARRSALISAAVTGKIDVRNWKSPVSESEQEAQPELAHG